MCQISHLCPQFPELLRPVVESEDLGWADKGEVKGVEEEHEVLAAVVWKEKKKSRFFYLKIIAD